MQFILKAISAKALNTYFILHNNRHENSRNLEKDCRAVASLVYFCVRELSSPFNKLLFINFKKKKKKKKVTWQRTASIWNELRTMHLCMIRKIKNNKNKI
jgi:hypothetical protein